ncbi:MAG TPA: hypothetical protein DCE56_28060 [Cyanobacteria bacterium UBA8553]|nr:hypothetical protein [Cyanobacteria bacterium UBA8553]
MRTLIYAAAFTLAFVAFNSATYGTPIKETAKFPHIVGSVQFPQTKTKIVRHTFRLQIPQESSALSQLIINVPRGLTVTNNIRVSDQSGRKINSKIIEYRSFVGAGYIHWCQHKISLAVKASSTQKTHACSRFHLSMIFISPCRWTWFVQPRFPFQQNLN